VSIADYERKAAFYPQIQSSGIVEETTIVDLKGIFAFRYSLTLTTFVHEKGLGMGVIWVLMIL